MAIREVGTVGSSTTNGADLSLDLTTITALAEGDLVIATFCVGDTSDRDMVLLSSDWTEVADLYGNDDNDCNLGVWYKYMGSSLDTAVQVEGFGAANAGVAGVARAFRGVASAAAGGPFDATSTTATGTNSSLSDPPSITYVSDGALIVLVGGAAMATFGTVTHPTGMFSENIAKFAGADTNDGVIALTSGPPPSNPYDPAAFANTGDAVTASWAAVTMALKPALPLGIHLVGGGGGFTNNGGDVVMTLPTNMRQGDLVIVTGCYGTTAGDVDLTITSGDYTEVADLFTNDTIDVNFGVWYKYMTGTPDTDVSFDGNANASDGVSAAFHVYRGVKQAGMGGPFDVAATTSSTTSTVFPNPPSIDWSGLPGRVAVVAGGGGHQTNSGLFIRAANSVVDFITAIGNDTNDGTIGLGSRYNPADPEDPAIFTGNAALVDNVNYASAACTMMLVPDPGYINVIVTGA